MYNPTDLAFGPPNPNPINSNLMTNNYMQSQPNTLAYPSFVPPPNSTFPSAPSAPNTGGVLGSGIGGLDMARLGLGGIQTIGSLWAAFQAQQLAEEQFDYTKDITNQNMDNQIQSYNTKLRDDSRVIAQYNGDPKGSALEYYRRNKLKRNY